MSNIKTIGASPLTGIIFYGTLNTEKGVWVGKKTDVTSVACQAVAEHLMYKKMSKVYSLPDNKELVLSAEIRESVE